MYLAYTFSETNGVFSRKSQNFPPCVYFPPADGVPLGIGYRRSDPKKLE